MRSIAKRTLCADLAGVTRDGTPTRSGHGEQVFTDVTSLHNCIFRFTPLFRQKINSLACVTDST